MFIYAMAPLLLLPLVFLMPALNVDSCLCHLCSACTEISPHQNCRCYPIRYHGINAHMLMFRFPALLQECLVEGSGSVSPSGFWANPQLSTGLVRLYRSPFESGWPCLLTPNMVGLARCSTSIPWTVGSGRECESFRILSKPPAVNGFDFSRPLPFVVDMPCLWPRTWRVCEE